MSKRLLMVGAFGAIYLLWGSTYLAIALGLKTIPPFLLMGLRSLGGGVILIALNGAEVMHVPRRNWLTASLCGVLFFVGCHGVLAHAQQSVPSGIAAIVLATIPFWVLLIDFLFPQGRRPKALTLAALLPGLAGVAIVAWQSAGQGHFNVIPILLLLGAAFSWAVGTVLSRRTSDHDSPILSSGLQLSIGGAVLLAISLGSGELDGFSPRSVSASSLAAVIYLAIAGSVIGFTAFRWLLDHVSTFMVSTYIFVNPIIAVLLGTLVLGEPFSVTMLLGAFLVIASVIITWRAELASPSPAKPARSTICARSALRSS
ncbi:drug/metabolite transporter (DMT)-like permease [Bradyrhizobium macuxiense]|uniref:Drug/metabolite transporter (DMT)-like permease n=1 Tax=Bradyrhizobium macuxiense TaxID=1755647 RepID=A0A560L119_9BRAD|nr:EamA family transporter [Bradyrhizobium macuxiense]TWB88084.1 drug/metabolite transporter (DMT)-like permease [Bradyrhizobium macuxiense]